MVSYVGRFKRPPAMVIKTGGKGRTRYVVLEGTAQRELTPAEEQRYVNNGEIPHADKHKYY